MADEQGATQEQSSWADDLFEDAPLPASAFDEPVEWPDALAWPPTAPPVEPVDVGLPPAPAGANGTADGHGDGSRQPIVVPPQEVPELIPDSIWGPAPDSSIDPGATSAVELLFGDAPRAEEGGLPLEPIPDSIWQVAPDDAHAVDAHAVDAHAVDAHAVDDLAVDDLAVDDLAVDDLAVAAPTVVAAPPVYAAPTVYAEPGRPGPGRFGGWFQLRHPTAAMAGLAVFVALVVVGLVLSVRSRPDATPTDAAQRGGTIAAQRAPSTTVAATTTTTTMPSVAIADLLPPTAEGAGAPGAGAPADTGATGSSGRAAPAATTPARSSTPAAQGGGGGGNVSTPATTTATTSAPVPDTTPPDTAPPDPGTTAPATSIPRRSTTIPIDFTVPTVTAPTTTPPPTSSDPDIPTVSFPDIPSIPRR